VGFFIFRQMKINYGLILLVFCIFYGCDPSEQPTIDKILAEGSKKFHSILTDPKYEVQIIYGEISEDSIIHHHFRVNETAYFYPASTIKMPVAFAAIKKAQDEGISLDDYFWIDSTEIYPRALVYDSIFRDSITIRNLIQKIFTVSDNSANNILFGWLGKDYINQLYESLNIQTRIIHQLGENAYSFKPISNEYSRQTTFIRNGIDTIFFTEQEQQWKPGFQPVGQSKGVGFMDSLGILVNEPFDFSKKNFVSLSNLLKILEAGVRPDLIPRYRQLELNRSYKKSLLETMSLLPVQLPTPFDTLTDNYVKFFLYGSDRQVDIPASMKIKNKVGWAYGYLSDIAYIENTEKDIHFFLAATIHVNENLIYNDGIYEYETIGLPFFDELGDLVYNYELDKIEHK